MLLVWVLKIIYGFNLRDGHGVLQQVSKLSSNLVILQISTWKRRALTLSVLCTLVLGTNIGRINLLFSATARWYESLGQLISCSYFLVIQVCANPWVKIHWSEGRNWDYVSLSVQLSLDASRCGDKTFGESKCCCSALTVHRDVLPGN